MNKTLEFYFDYGSPTSYLAYKRLPALCGQHGAALAYKPVLLGGIFKATNNSPPGMVPAKGRYMLADMARFARRDNVALQFNPHFPVNTLALMRGAFAALELDVFDAYSNAVFDAMWVTQENMGDLEVMQKVLVQAQLPVANLLSLAQTDAIKTQLKDATAEAVDRGVFGCPTLFVGNEMFFGQDRMDFVAEALAG